MRRIFKYLIGARTRDTVAMPEGAEILSVGIQDDVPVIWAAVKENAFQTQQRTFQICTTGEAMPESGWNADLGKAVEPKFLATVTTSGGYVLHVFELSHSE